MAHSAGMRLKCVLQHVTGPDRTERSEYESADPQKIQAKATGPAPPVLFASARTR